MLSACLFYTFFNVLAKYLVSHFSPGEMGFARFGFGALMMLPVLSRQKSGFTKRLPIFDSQRFVTGCPFLYGASRLSCEHSQ
jgi:drug/metabolite transporter (DMT)-like permease